MKDIVFRTALRLQIPTVLVANQRMPVPSNNPHVRTVRVEGGPDVADAHIAEHARSGDVAVTADIPLAALLVPRGVIVLDHRGERFTPENIGERLSIRDFMDTLRSTGVETGGPRPYGTADKQNFANALDRTLTAVLRQRG